MKWGFIDKFGKEVIPLIYDYAKNFDDGLAQVKKGDKWGFIDKNGKEVTPFFNYDCYLVIIIIINQKEKNTFSLKVLSHIYIFAILAIF